MVKRRQKEIKMSREFIDAIELGKNLEAENVFKTAITTKIGDSLENKRKEISKNFVGKYEDQNGK